MGSIVLIARQEIEDRGRPRSGLLVRAFSGGGGGLGGGDQAIDLSLRLQELHSERAEGGAGDGRELLAHVAVRAAAADGEDVV